MKNHLKTSKIITNKHQPRPSELPHPSPPNYSGYQEKQQTNHPILQNRKNYRKIR